MSRASIFSEASNSSDSEDSIDGYLVSTTGGYKYYQQDPDEICAYKGSIRVGTLEYTELESEEVWLADIDVKESHQKKGIGSELIRLAVEMHGDDFKVPLTVGHHGDRFEYYLSEEGNALIYSCLRKNYLSMEKHCNATPPLNTDHRDYSDGDTAATYIPIYDSPESSEEEYQPISPGTP